MSISTHVLDLVKGGPASGVPIRLERHDGEGFVVLVEGATDDDGRIGGLVPKGSGKVGVHRIRFDTGAWFEAQGTRGFYPYVEVVFEVVEPESHHHVPLLLGPYGYSTYRGS